uniref:Paired domain-containing protein n=1 Tax=Panagrellus redivivus TaxID=6233 RepID=A0A7E4VAB0_PANRE
MERNNIVHSSIMGQGKVNQLGGHYINGRPLSTQTREAIVKLYKQGEKPCNISRRLQVSHGAVSKILTKYENTGSIQPGQTGGTPRIHKSIVYVENEIKAMLASSPQIQPKEIRSALIEKGLCTKEDAPKVASIGRLLTKFKRAISDNATRKKARSKKTPHRPSPVKLEQPSPPLPYSIDGILGSSSANQANISATVPTSSNTSTSNDSPIRQKTDADIDTLRPGVTLVTFFLGIPVATVVRAGITADNHQIGAVIVANCVTSDGGVDAESLVFPEEVVPDSYKTNEFARISVTVGGNSDVWPEVLLKNQSRVEFLIGLNKLSLPDGGGNVTIGNVASLESAVKTFYDSSEALLRLVILITDEVLTSDSESEYAKLLSSISEITSIVGIPSFQNPSFNSSMDAAITLAGQRDTVYESIDYSLNKPDGFSLPKILRLLSQVPTRICRRIAFLYEDSIYVKTDLQKQFASFVNQSTSAFLSTDGVAIASFDDLLNDELVFLQVGRIFRWEVKPSYLFNVDNGSNVYDKLTAISQTRGFQHLDVILLTQSDVYADNITESMDNLANQPNVDVFVFDVSENQTNSAIFEVLTKNRTDRIFNVANSTEPLTQIYAENVYPAIAKQNCKAVVPVPTSENPMTAPIETTTPTTIQTTTNGAGDGLSVVFGVFLVLVGVLTV